MNHIYIHILSASYISWYLVIDQPYVFIYLYKHIYQPFTYLPWFIRVPGLRLGTIEYWSQLLGGCGSPYWSLWFTLNSGWCAFMFDYMDLWLIIIWIYGWLFGFMADYTVDYRVNSQWRWLIIWLNIIWLSNDSDNMVGYMVNNA